MAKKTPVASKKKPVAKPVSTPVRYSALPKIPTAKVAVVKPRSFSREDIALKAYFISLSTRCGSETENWLKAEAELAAGL